MLRKFNFAPLLIQKYCKEIKKKTRCDWELTVPLQQAEQPAINEVTFNHQIKYVTIEPTRCTNFSKVFNFGMKLYMFRTVPLSSGVFSLCTQKWYMSYRFADSLRAGSGWKCVPSWSCLWYNAPKMLPATGRQHVGALYHKL